MDTKQPWTLYLDFDGVLNNDVFLRDQRNHVPTSEHSLFAPENIAAANLLCRELPVSSISITSSWRIGRSIEQLRELLQGGGFEHSHLVTSATPATGDRPAEIRAHAEANGIQRFIVLDDINLSPLRRPQFFQTSSAVGLREALCRDILTTLL